MKISWSSLNEFVLKHFLVIIVVLCAGWWLFGNNNVVTPFSSYGGAVMEESMMMDMDMARAPKMMMAGRGGGGYFAESNNGYIPNAEDRKIIKNGSLSVEVADTEKARMEAEAQIAELDGEITNMNSWEVRPGVLSYNFTVRIPSDNLDTAMEALAFLGVKKSENISTNDITASYTDTENQLENLKARRTRLRELMDRETKDLGDVLKVDRELSSVQMQIENLERTQKRRDVNVSHSTLNLSLMPETQIGDVSDPHWTFTKSWRVAINDLIGSAHGIADKIIKVIAYIPLWVPALIVLWILKVKFVDKKKVTKKKK
jgi:hypothetical protein